MLLAANLVHLILKIDFQPQCISFWYFPVLGYLSWFLGFPWDGRAQALSSKYPIHDCGKQNVWCHNIEQFLGSRPWIFPPLSNAEVTLKRFLQPPLPQKSANPTFWPWSQDLHYYSVNRWSEGTNVEEQHPTPLLVNRDKRQNDRNPPRVRLTVPKPSHWQASLRQI